MAYQWQFILNAKIMELTQHYFTAFDRINPSDLLYTNL